MKKNKIIMALIFAGLLLSPVFVYAYPHGGGDGRHDKELMKKMDAQAKEIFKDLGLSAEQTKMLEDNKSKHREEMKASFEAMRAKEALLRDELQRESLDIGKITQINNELKDIQLKMTDQKLAGILEVRKILTPEQFRKFNKKIEERREQRHKK